MKYTIEAKSYGSYDVVVCGGGTAGCFAAIAAARGGVKTLLIERSFKVGGMLTVGNAGITKFTEHCRDVDVYKSEVLDVLATEPERVQVVRGTPHEFVDRLLARGGGVGTNGVAGSYIFSEKAAAEMTLLEMLDEAGVTVLYDTRICLANSEDGILKNIVVCNKDGFAEINAKYFIDCTGDADVAAQAGVPFRVGASEYDVEKGGAKTVGELQHMGAMHRVRGVDFEKLFAYLEENPDRFFQHEFGVMSLENVKESYRNGEMCVFRVMADVPGIPGRRPVQFYNLPEKDEAIILGHYAGYHGCGIDAFTLSDAQKTLQLNTKKMKEYLRAIPGLENLEFIYIPDVGVRETRHIEGEYTITEIDVLSSKRFEDSVACGGHPIDIHPLPPEIENIDLNHWRFYIPYRVMLPKGIDNLLIAGRAISATRMASGAIRPTAQCMALGEAAGVATAILTENGGAARDIDIKLLQENLKKNGAIF
ncbi:MAG: FAD-dependent oxidoreductase [Clostridia bacterium]|nr:FAD-dependent oxidoreductase [Clostridia bacterium]